MSSFVGPDLASLLLAADEAEFGIAVITNDPRLLRNQLYAERKRLGMTHLSFAQPHENAESRLWIIKKEAKGNGAAEE